MHKILMSLPAAVIMASGVVAAPMAAHAAPNTGNCAGPDYTGCVKTDTDLRKLPLPHRNARRYEANVTAGNARPGGTIRFTLRQQGGRLIRAATKDAPTARFSTGRRHNGTYTIKACYIPDSGSVYAGSCASRTFTFD